ncbi:hypothetical protein IM538_12095 [Cytobacillus suaedae]|nr:hypothetical protein IM538_12095 [Cytobacillus suaedae]
MNEKEYVWYASYGSNINVDRFLCYIKGGQPEGSSEIEVGCRDSSLPIDEDTFTINHPLYFAKEAGKWNNQGVAFIGHNKSEDLTYSKKYLITTEQFFDVVKQENSGTELDIDLGEIMAKGIKTLRSSWYGTILYLRESKGYPVFTFTAPWDMNQVELNKPSHAYLSTIIKGLKINYSNEEIYNYFISKPGIEGNYSEEELRSLLVKM